MKHRFGALLLAVLLCFSCLGTAWAAGEEEGEAKSSGTLIEVSLRAGSSKAKSNYKALEQALKQGGGSKSITVRIQKPGTYHVHSGGGGAIMLRSHTTLDLNGSTLVRAGRMTNLLQNCSKGGKRAGRGYSISCDITVMNGTLNGSGGVKREINLVNMGHASGLRFSNVNFRNSRSHLIELNGCKDCTIENCTFSGHKGCSTDEALQLDISNGKAGWNGVYAKGKGGDCTPCRNITVSGCTFQNYPSGVGNHHTVKGRHNSGIRILNNRFVNTGSSKAPAIWCYAFDKSEVSGNTITGKYQYGIRVSGGSVEVQNNTIGSASRHVSYRAIYVLRAHSNHKGSNSRSAENVTGGLVDNNTIYSTCKKSSIFIAHKSKLASVSGNSFHVPGEKPLSVEGSSTVLRQADNKRL